ncbi:MAG: MMPL family transporter, partial [Candidatus Nanoarchaeia archaeon]
MSFEWIKKFYEKHEKKLFLIPLLMIIGALLVVGYHYTKTGDIFRKDVTLSGGITATVYTSIEVKNIENAIKETTNKEVIVRKLAEFGSDQQKGVVIESAEITKEELESALTGKLKIELTKDNYSLEQTGATLGQSFYKEMMIALLIGFLMMSIVVVIIFRAVVPSAAVILSAFADMLCTIAVVDLLGMRMSTAGIAGVLLLIGYSVDTDILLTTRMYKRKEGRIMDRIFSSAATGLTMTAAGLAALGIGYLITTSFVIKEMFLVLIIGLVMDVIMTYLLNARLILWYTE